VFEHANVTANEIFLFCCRLHSQLVHKTLQHSNFDWLGQHVCRHFSCRLILQSYVASLQALTNVALSSDQMLRTLERRALNGHDNRSLIILQHCDGTIGSHSKISKQRLVPDCIG